MDFQDEVSDIVRFEEQKQKSFFFFSTLALSMTIGIFGILGGFIYGDYYGRKHAQFDNDELRQHYAGQCYSYIESTLKKSIKSSLDKASGKHEQLERLDQIKAMMRNLQLDVEHLASGETRRLKDKEKEKAKIDNKKKVASTR